jgi:uncharacterized protein with HEPN domain
MHPRTPYDLWELQRATTYLIDKTNGVSVEILESDYDLQLIVERVLERIGETLRRMSNRDPGIASQIPDIRRAIDQRNLIAHEYYEIEWGQIHSTLKSAIPKLHQVVEQLIADHPEEMKL